jgi:hypothetical protein
MSDPHARHVRPLNLIQPHIWITETLAGHVQSPDPTHLASQPFPELTKHIWLPGRIPEAFPRHVWPRPRHVWPDQIPQRLSPGLDISGPQAGFQRGGPDMSSPRPRHIWVSNTPTASFGCLGKTRLSDFRNRTVQFWKPDYPVFTGLNP